jgi:ArsR family transcriptional regulator, arsenate/arsenite/antimonite-responsive transcriptional repressor
MVHALGDETRLEILERRGEGEQRGRDLTVALEPGPSLMSFHLRALKDASRLRDRRAARWVYWSLDPANVETVKEWIGALAGAAEVVRVAQRCSD